MWARFKKICLHPAFFITIVTIAIIPIGFLLMGWIRFLQGCGASSGASIKLKQIARAIQNYHDDHQTLPPAAILRDGKPVLSWRVLLLPYLEEDELFKQFNLNEPWDSETNLPLLKKMPEVYRVPFQSTTGKTHHQLLIGAGTVFEKDGLTLSDVTDGVGNTILVVERAHAVPWTKPKDIVYDPKGALPEFHPLWFDSSLISHVVMVDGTIRKIVLDEFDKQELRALVTRNGGEKLTEDWLKSGIY